MLLSMIMLYLVQDGCTLELPPKIRARVIVRGGLRGATAASMMVLAMLVSLCGSTFLRGLQELMAVAHMRRGQSS